MDAVLVDFDSARVLDAALSSSTDSPRRAPPEPPALSTTYYTAPELLARERRGGALDATPAGDVYAFGMLLTRMAWPNKSMRRIMSTSRTWQTSTDTDANGPRRVPLPPGSAAMPTDIAELVADCVAASPLARPEARHVHARISNVRLIVAPAEPPPSEVDQGTGFELARGRAAHAAKCEPW